MTSPSPNVLNLADADLKGFDPFSGTHDAIVWEVKREATKGGEDAKLPTGTPMYVVQFQIEGGEYDKRRVFRRYVLPPKKIAGKDYEHYKMMTGQFARFLTAIGYSEEEVTSGKFELDLEDMKGRECRVTCRVSGEYTEVTGVKPRNASEDGDGLL